MRHAEELRRIVREDPILWPALLAAREMDLPDWWIVAGAVYDTVWNVLAGRPAGHGIRDIDLFYFDPDTSWEAEDRVIRAAAGRFAATPPVEIRNQARVHLWYADHFGHAIAPLRDCRDSIAGFAARTHAVGVRLTDGDAMEICAPFGLDDIFALRLVPNLRNPNRAPYTAKAARMKATWPEIEVVPWPVIDRLDEAGADEDWPALLAMIRRAFAFMEGRIDPPSSLHRLDEAGLAAKAAEEICLLARIGGDAVGCVFCKPERDHLYIGKLAVDPQMQRHGIGRWLMQAAEDRARRLGLEAVQLQTRIELVENHAAFGRLGFARIGETAHEGFDRPTSITMRKTL